MLATLRGRPAPLQQRADPAAIRMKIIVPQRSSGPPPAPRQQIDARPSAAVRQADPVRLDAEVIRRASSQGKGALQRMAEAAGVDLQRRPVSAGASLASNLTRSARPGCLDPDPAGSLLSIPSIALSAITGKCG